MWELQMRRFMLGPRFSRQGAVKIFHSQDGKRGPKHQVVRTGFLQPQNFACNSGPDDLTKAGRRKSLAKAFLHLICGPRGRWAAAQNLYPRALSVRVCSWGRNWLS